MTGRERGEANSDFQTPERLRAQCRLPIREPAIPTEFWAELRQQGLIEAKAALPFLID